MRHGLRPQRKPGGWHCDLYHPLMQLCRMDVDRRKVVQPPCSRPGQRRTNLERAWASKIDSVNSAPVASASACHDKLTDKTEQIHPRDGFLQPHDRSEPDSLHAAPALCGWRHCPARRADDGGLARALDRVVAMGPR